jgi:hypothetical protein
MEDSSKMPKRKTTTVRQHGSVSPHEIEKLRDAVNRGFPWFFNHPDNQYRQSGLSSRLNILLSYVTGIYSMDVGCAGGSHPSKETVETVRAILNDDLVRADEMYGHFVPFEDRWSYQDLFEQSPNQPPRDVY